MKVALTVWEGRISPLFDAARELLVADIEEKGVINNRRHEPITPQWPLRVVERLVEQGVTVLICGAISEVPAGMMEAAGIKLVAFVAGPVDDVLGALAKGRPIIPTFSMPGCGCPKCPRPGGRRRGNLVSFPGSGKLPARSSAHGVGGQNRNDRHHNMTILKIIERGKGEE
ncbi:MAG: NifB/NifX family molybdenum-iron cluster-binding protein [Pseudomonadota bacterium]